MTGFQKTLQGRLLRDRSKNEREYVQGKGKGKAVPLQAWTGPEGS